MSKAVDYDSGEYKRYSSKMEFDKTLNMLRGMLDGLTADNITVKEIEELQHWLQFAKPFSEKRPFDELIPIVNAALEDGVVTQDEIDDILWVCNSFSEPGSYYDAITAGLQMLNGYIHGIMADNSLSVQEIMDLKKWIVEHDELTGYFPYDELYSLLVSILKDGIVTSEEQAYLKAFLSQFVDTKKSLNLNEVELSNLRKEISLIGVCALAPDIEFDNRKFCFTGASIRTTRKELANLVYSLNGQFSDTVTKDTAYLIVGSAGNDCWAFSCYGRKVEQAINLRKKGVPVVIVHENDFWDAVEDVKSGI